MVSRTQGVAFLAMRHHFIRRGFVNELLGTKAIRQTLWADLSTDEEFLEAAAQLALTLDGVGKLLGFNQRRDLFENVAGSFRLKPLSDLGPSSTLLLVSMYQALASHGRRWDSARDRITGPGGEVHEGISKWVLERAPTMPWLVDDLVDGFRKSWLNIVLYHDAALVVDRAIVIPPPMILAPIEIQLRFEAGTPVTTVEETIGAGVAQAREKIAEAKKAWGPMPAKKAETLETWGRWACRVIVFKRSRRSVALEHFRTEDNPESRIKDVRDGVRNARESLESEVPPSVRVLSSFG